MSKWKRQLVSGTLWYLLDLKWISKSANRDVVQILKAKKWIEIRSNSHMQLFVCLLFSNLQKTGLTCSAAVQIQETRQSLLQKKWSWGRGRSKSKKSVIKVSKADTCWLLIFFFLYFLQRVVNLNRSKPVAPCLCLASVKNQARVLQRLKHWPEGCECLLSHHCPSGDRYELGCTAHS